MQEVGLDGRALHAEQSRGKVSLCGLNAWKRAGGLLHVAAAVVATHAAHAVDALGRVARLATRASAMVVHVGADGEGIEKQQAEELYQKHFGPLTLFDASTDKRWNWIDEPWPWEV